MVALRDPQELVGAVLGRTWKLVRVIGQGGLGIVYEASHLRGGATSAVKLLQHEFVEEEATVARFLSEAEAASRLDHPGIVRVFEAARAEDGTPYLVMELLVGQPLSQLMRAGRIPAERALELMRQLLLALASVHDAGVIHRDVKPDNVFVITGPAGEEQVKLLDLGLARVMDAAGGMSRKTKTGMMLGTPGYMSPEQIKNVKDSDLRSDLWAVGVILYELVTGRQAFGAPTEFARMTAALTEDAAPPSRYVPELSGWDAFMQRALAKEPSERFQSAVEMLRALNALTTGGATEGAVPTQAAPHAGAPFPTAVHQSTPPSPGAIVVPSAPPPPMTPHLPTTNTRISADNPALSGYHDVRPPEVMVVTPRSPVPLQVPFVVALLMSAVCLVVGVLIGFLLD